MKDIWLISDTHFGHTNIIKYCNRPFHNVKEMDEYMIQQWNKTVKDGDIVYHLGDVYFPGGYDDGGQSIWRMLTNLKGKKRLVLGNHDEGHNQLLRTVFKKITAWRHFKEFGLLLTHVPVHPETLHDKVPVNVHGHIHNRKMQDKRYINVSVECINYTPINIDEVRVR